MTNSQRKPTFKPSPLQPYVDAGAPPEILLEGHRVQRRPALIAAIAGLVTAVTVGIATVVTPFSRPVALPPPQAQVVQADVTPKDVPAPKTAR